MPVDISDLMWTYSLWATTPDRVNRWPSVIWLWDIATKFPRPGEGWTFRSLLGCKGQHALRSKAFATVATTWPVVRPRSSAVLDAWVRPNRTSQQGHLPPVPISYLIDLPSWIRSLAQAMQDKKRSADRWLVTDRMMLSAALYWQGLLSIQWHLRCSGCIHSEHLWREASAATLINQPSKEDDHIP